MPQLSAPSLLPAASPAETRQGGNAISLWRHRLCTDLGTTCSNAVIYFTKSSNSKKQLRDGLLLHPQSGTVKKFTRPKGRVNWWHPEPQAYGTAEVV